MSKQWKKAPGKHSKEEIISEEELDNRIAIDGDIRLYFTMYLKIFIDGHFRHPKKKKLINLAQYIYDQKVLYIHKHGGYKLMELSSIHAELGALKKPVEEEYMKEKRKKENRLKRSKASTKKKIMGQLKYKAYLRRRFQPVEKQKVFLLKK